MASRSPRRARRKAPPWLYPAIVIGVTALLLGLINMVFYASPPSWIGDPVTYALVNRAIASLVVVFTAQAFATLVLGMSAGIISSEAPRGLSAVDLELPTARQCFSRLRRSLWLVFSLRALGLLVLFLAAMNMLAGFQSFQGRAAFSVLAFFTGHPFLLGGVGIILFALVLAEPFLFARVSGLLGLVFGAKAVDEARPLVSAVGSVAFIVIFLLSVLILGAIAGGVWDLLVDPPPAINGGITLIAGARNLIPTNAAPVINRVLMAAAIGALAILTEGILLTFLPRLARRRLAAWQPSPDHWRGASAVVDKTSGLG